MREINLTTYHPEAERVSLALDMDKGSVVQVYADDTRIDDYVVDEDHGLNTMAVPPGMKTVSFLGGVLRFYSKELSPEEQEACDKMQDDNLRMFGFEPFRNSSSI